MSLAALVALAPAGAKLWFGRRFAALIDDAALPERLLEHRKISAFTIAIPLIGLIYVWPQYIYWTLPLMIVTRTASAYPFRKLLYGETWSVGSYLSFFLRLLVAAYGFWVVLAFAPWFAFLGGRFQWVAATAQSLLLFAWSVRYADAFRYLLRTRPVERPDLIARFRSMATTAGIPAVRLEYVDMRGGVLANALALPSLRGHSVLVTSTLLERLDFEEVVAICAHELAHFDHFTRARLRRSSAATWTLIAVGMLSPILVRRLPGVMSFLPFLWLIAFTVVMAMRAGNRQKHETASDIRAVALTGNPEALVSALSKLHALGRVPRRWQAEVERRATHPSLARRIQAIRGAAATTAPSLAGPAQFSGSDGSASIVFHPERLEWHEGDAASYSLGYRHLTELRVDAARAGAPILVARDRTGRQWRTPLAVADVTRLQGVLDVVDSQLLAANPAKNPSAPMLRLLPAILLVVSAMSGQLAVAFTLLLAVIEPTVAFFAAASLAAAAAAVITWRDRLADFSLPITVVVVLLVIATVLCAAAWVVRKTSDQPRVPRLAAALALGATIAWLLVSLGGVDVIRLHQGIRAWPSAAILPMALAVVLVWERNALARRASLFAAIIGTVAAFAGSTMFLDYFSSDPLLAASPSITVRTVSTTPLVEFPVPLAANGLKLGPGGRFVAIVSENDDEQSIFHVGPAGGRLVEFEADEGVFVGDRHMLLVASGRSGTTVRDLELADPSVVVREQRIASLASGRLSVDTVSGRWSLIGSGDQDDIVNVQGQIGTDRVDEHRWKLPPTTGGYLIPLAAAGDDVIAVETRYGRSLFSGGPFWRWAPLLSASNALAQSRILAFGPGTSVDVMSSQFAIQCQGVSVDGEGPVCAAFDGTRTRFFTVDLPTRRLEMLGVLPGRFASYDYSARSWMSGWWSSRPLSVRLESGDALTILPAGPSRVTSLAVAGKVAGALVFKAPGFAVRLYSLP